MEPPPSPSLLGVPRHIRDNIYRRVLVVGHSMYIFQDSPAQGIEVFAPEKPAQWTALLRVNGQVHDEASQVLYRTNRFTLVDTDAEEIHLLQSFLETIGPRNSSHLALVRINFPSMEKTDDSSLALLRQRCTRLATLDLVVHTEGSRRLVLASKDDLPSIREALLPMDEQLKAIPSLDRVTVRFFNGLPDAAVVALMQSLGWHVCRGERASVDVQRKG